MQRKQVRVEGEECILGTQAIYLAFLKLTPRPSKDIFDTAGQDDFSYVQADF